MQSQNLENITAESTAETPVQETPQGTYGARTARYSSSRETGARNLPQYSPTRTAEEPRTANIDMANSPRPLRALQRAQFQDSSIRRFELGDRTSEYYSQQEKPDFAKQDFENPHVQSASRGKREVDLKEYEI